MNTADIPPTASEAGHDFSVDRALVNAFLHNVADHVYFKDLQSRFITASTSQLLVLGCSTESEVRGRTDFDFFNPTHATRAYEDEQRIIRTGQPMLSKLENETWPDGRVTWVMTSKLPLRNERGEIIGTFGVSKDVTKQKETELALERAQRELVDASRLAGMAEVATGVLHNVGNVLNSLNVSASVITAGFKQSKIENLAKVSALLRDHASDLGDFLTNDPKGRRIPEFLESLAVHSLAERDRLLAEAESLQRNVDHIKEIVAMQQSYATMVSIIEPLDATALMEDSLRMNLGALARHSVNVIRDFKPAPQILAEKAKVLQILVNLIRNAKYAADDGGREDKSVTLRIEPTAEGRVRLTVADNGVGIPPENLTRIFAHGFTTRVGGHGFGLHSSANAAREMKGSLTVHSDGLGLGAAFTLELPSVAPTGATS
ncbi:MAG TPA: ATP-binding protein [Opitutus sp.]|nr:ATP-binding protein [Opitutus sp.]